MSIQSSHEKLIRDQDCEKEEKKTTQTDILKMKM